MASVSVTFSYNPDHYPELHAWLEAMRGDKSAQWRQFMTAHLTGKGCLQSEATLDSELETSPDSHTLRDVLETVQRIEAELKASKGAWVVRDEQDEQVEPVVSKATRANLLSLGRRS